MNSASARQPASETPPSSPPKKSRRWVFVIVMVFGPLLAGLAWNRASDNPLWPIFRGSLNLCSLQTAELAPLSPDGRYRVHVVQATCAARFPETMVFLTEAEEAFPLSALDPNRAVLEVAGHRTLDAVVWQSAAESRDGKMSLHLWTLKGSMPEQLHRFENHWRDVPVYLNSSKPAPGAEKLDY